MLKHQTAKITKGEALEELRKRLVGSMLHGKALVINVDNLRPSFRVDYASSEFPDTVFNFDEWRKHENYIQVVKDEENVNIYGLEGAFYMDTKFTIMFLATYKSDEDIADFVKKIPFGE